MGFVHKKLRKLGSDVVSTTSLASALGVTSVTIRRHIRSRKLKATKVGGVYHIRLTEAVDYLNKYWIC